MRLLNSKPAFWLTGALLVQGAFFYAIASRPELAPPVSPLSTFPRLLGSWQLSQDIPIEKDIQDVLRADDTMNRLYVYGTSGAIPPEADVCRYAPCANLFVAYFKTQRSGQSPHSPKNCLPGSGYEPVETPSRIPIRVPGRAEPIIAN